MFGKTGRQKGLPEEKILDVNASMQGTISFKEPVNLKINGRFEGTLDIRGNLTIGPQAVVNANINGDDITIAGRVNGDITAGVRLKLASTAQLMGNVKAPIFSIEEGACFHGNSQMTDFPRRAAAAEIVNDYLTMDELVRFLEVDSTIVKDWVKTGKIPASKDGNALKFRRDEIERWLASEQVK